VRKISASRICLAPVIPQVRRARPKGAFRRSAKSGHVPVGSANDGSVQQDQCCVQQGKSIPSKSGSTGRSSWSSSSFVLDFLGGDGHPQNRRKSKDKNDDEGRFGRITLHTSAWAVRFSFHQKRSNRFLHRTDLSLDQGQQLFGHTPSHFLGAIVDSRQRGG
jgi:hypothetical protein